MKQENVRTDNIEKIIKNNNFPNVLCHYTSLAAFFNIIKENEFWIGNALGMNDSEEGIYFINRLKEELEKTNCNNEDELNRFFSNIYKRVKKEYPYVMCFSKLADNAAQWERYADNAQGICIEFDTRSLMAFFYECPTVFKDVYYEKDVTQHKHFKLLKQYFQTGEMPLFNTGNKEKDEKAWSDSILVDACIYKHPSFVSEEEVRVSPLWGYIYKTARKEYVFVNGRIKEVLKLNILKQCNKQNVKFEDMIRKIIIGPKSKQNIQVVRNFLKENNYDDLSNRVFKSECPLQ